MGSVASTVFQLLAVAAPPVERNPTGPWSVEYADNMCVLSRGFGGDAPSSDVSLMLRPLPLSTTGEMIVAVPAGTTIPSKHGKLKVKLLPSGEERQFPFTRWRNEAANRLLTSFDIPTAFLDELRGSNAVEVTTGKEGSLRLAIGNTTKALAALKPCQDDLLKKWGYDPDIAERIGTPAVTIGGSIGTFFDYGAYPLEAVRLGQEGRTTVAWTIDTTGKTKDCRIIDSSGYRALDLTTCAVFLQRVRYKPALDRSGNPMVSYQTMAIRWSLAN